MTDAPTPADTEDDPVAVTEEIVTEAVGVAALCTTMVQMLLSGNAEIAGLLMVTIHERGGLDAVAHAVTVLDDVFG